MDSLKAGYEFLSKKMAEKDKALNLGKASFLEMAELLGYKEALIDIAKAFKAEIEEKNGKDRKD